MPITETLVSRSLEALDAATVDWPARFKKLLNGRRVAIVHDWFTVWSGAERVVEQFLGVMPEADLFALIDFLPAPYRSRLQGRTPKTTFLQKLPGARRYYRSLLPLMPLTIENLDLSGYDVVLTSSHAVAKGVLTTPRQLHICYCYTPMRYAWDLQNQYLREASGYGGLKGLLARVLLHYLRIWDVRTAYGVDVFLSVSSFVSSRIEKVYRRSSTVLHPPVDTQYFQLNRKKRSDYYITVSRLVPYKCVPLMIEAFNRMPNRRLLVVGTGPEERRCRMMAGPNVQVLGHLGPEKLREALQSAKAFLYAAEEDFGIVMAEAQACGTPVICYGEGGARDIVTPGITGEFFHRQSAEAIRTAIEEFEQKGQAYDANVVRLSAERFSPDRFRSGLYRIMEENLRSGSPSSARA